MPGRVTHESPSIGALRWLQSNSISNGRLLRVPKVAEMKMRNPRPLARHIGWSSPDIAPFDRPWSTSAPPEPSDHAGYTTRRTLPSLTRPTAITGRDWRDPVVPTPERFASYNGTAPTEASSGPVKRHRLNPRGNRKLNHAIHMASVTQIRHDTPGRADYKRKLTEGKSKKEALRALKRRISDAIWRQLQVDLGRR